MDYKNIKYHTVSLTSTGAGENLTNAIDGIGEKKRTILSAIFSPDFASTPASTITLRATVDSDEILDYWNGHFQDLDSDTKQYLAFPREIELNLELTVGQQFRVGFHNTASGNGGTVTIKYVDE